MIEASRGTPAVATQLSSTRERILQSATQLFSRQGFSSTPLSRVAERARVSKALIFWHFGNKANLFQAVLERVLDAFAVHVDDDLGGLSETAQITRLIADYSTFVSSHLASVKFLLGFVLRGRPRRSVQRLGELHAAYRDMLAAALEAGQQKGTFEAHLQPTLHANLIMAALHGILLHLLLEPEEARESEALGRHLTRRLVEEPGRERQRHGRETGVPQGAE
jgi:AcrR family transcriptional regulator